MTGQVEVTGIQCRVVEQPFTRAVAHGLAVNRATANLVVRLQGAGGQMGLGEGVPRDYVTGESLADSLAFLQKTAPELLLGRTFEARQVLEFSRQVFSDELAGAHPAAICALEVALWDLAGRELGLPCSVLLGQGGQPPSREITYSAVVPIVREPAVLMGLLGAIKQAGYGQVKVKLGFEGDMAHLALIRRELGPDCDLRVDVNGAWGLEQALDNLGELERLGVSTVEQPVSPRHDEAWEALRQASHIGLMADESLCGLADARRLIEQGAVSSFNLKLSKLGGPGRAWEILALARQNGLDAQLGCQVGELGILGAAGRHFAAAAGDLRHVEGCLTRFFASDITDQDLTPGPGGRAPALTGPGLGIDVDPAQLSGGG